MLLRLAALGLAASWPLYQTPAQATAAANPPNILLILADDMGWSDLGCYGNHLIDTPHIDGLATQGMRFTDAYAMPVCTPTRVSIHSGKNPATLKIQHPNPHNRPYAKLLTPRQHWQLPLNEITIAEALAVRGYASFHVGKWGSGHTRQEQGYMAIPTELPTGPYSAAVRAFEKANPEKNMGMFVRQSVRFIEAHQDQPFFCILSAVQVHTSLEARANLIEKYQRRFALNQTVIHPIYAAMVEVFDESVGVMLNVIEQLGLADNTVVIVASDNGGVENERGYVPGGWDGPVTHNWPLRNEKGSLYEGGIRVPFIVRWPKHITPGALSHERIACYDLLPTFCDIAGASYPPTSLDGVSFLPVLEGRGQLQREALYWHYPRYHHSTPSSAIIAGDYKLIYFYEDERKELYNLNEDLGERFDLSEQQPETTATLKQKLFAWLASVDAAIPQPNPNFDERNQLIWGPRDPQTWTKSFALPQ